MDAETKTIQHGAYQITTDLYHPDIPYSMPAHLLSTMTKAYRKALQNSKSAQKQLEKWMVEYPKVPQFKDMLSLHYSLRGEKEKSNRLNRELVQHYPNYVHGRINLATEALIANEPDQVTEFLGPQLSLAALYPNRQVFLYDEYKAFYRLLFDYYCHLREVNKAEDILNDLKELARQLKVEEYFEALDHLLLLAKLGGRNLVSDHSERGHPTLPQTHEAPHFRLPQTIQLYQHAFSTLPNEVITDLLATDREQLRLDLEDVVRDAIQRYYHFSRQETSFHTTTFPLHALYLLQEIRSEQSLPVVLELLRQPEEILEYWLGDLLTGDIWPVLYTLGLHQLSLLADYLKEPLNHTYARVEVLATLQQVALHHPERRQEVLALMKDLLEFYMAQADDDTLMDGTVVAFLINYLAEMKAGELVPEIKSALNTVAVDTFVIPDFAEVEKVMDSPQDYKLPLKSYFQQKEELGALETRNAPGAAWKKEEHDNTNWPSEQDDEDYSDWEEVDKEPRGLFHSGHEPYVREEPKLGRNDPCYCGSGKKYKHCHGKS